MTVDLLLHLPLLGEESVEIGVGLGEGGGDRVEAIEQVAQRPDAVLDVAADVLGGIEVGLLRSQPTVAPAANRRCRSRLLDAGHDPQQRRLPGAVRPEHADLRAREERERDVVEHLALGPVELGGPDHREDVVGHDGRG